MGKKKVRSLDRKLATALTSVAHLVGHHPAKQKVSGAMPSQGMCLGCGFGPWSGHVQKTTNGCFSPSLPPSLSQNELKFFN